VLTSEIMAVGCVMMMMAEGRVARRSGEPTHLYLPDCSRTIANRRSIS
jgi:hypothetical protein